MVTAPAALLMAIPVPAVRVVRAKPVPVPMSIWPTAGVAESPVPPLATGSVPVTPVPKTRPVAFVRTAALGVPRFGVVNTGLVSVSPAIVVNVPPNVSDVEPSVSGVEKFVSSFAS
jgi:hypothetical protein